MKNQQGKNRLDQFFVITSLITSLTLPTNLNAQPVKSLGSGEMLPKNLFIELGKRVNPTVVNISTTQIVRSQYRGGFGFPGGSGGGGRGLPFDPFQQFLEEMMPPGQMPEQKVTSLGSGFIIDPSGLIITNNHVIQDATDIQVQLTEKAKEHYKAKVVGHDARTDIAIIKIDVDRKLPIAVLGDSDQVEVGEWVAAFGNPFGHGHSMTKGIISAKERNIDIESSYFPFLQTDASINPGNSGGPLVNEAGDVIGVNSAIDARAQGIGFAIPINIVKKLLPELKTKGKITRGFLGVGLANINEKMVKQFRLKSDRGALIVDINPGTPAERAGIQPYDIVTEYSGNPIEDSRALANAVSESKIGESVPLKVIREGKSKNLTVKISERPTEGMAADESEGPDKFSPAPGSKAPFNMGLGLADLTPQIARQLDLRFAPRKGVVVVDVRPGSLADQAGIQPGDIVLDINKKPAKSAREAVKNFTKGNNSLRILRGNSSVIIFMDADGDR